MVQLNSKKIRVYLLLSLLFTYAIMGFSPSVLANDTVSFQVIGDDDSGIMLKETEVSFEKGDTPLSVLLRHGKNKNVIVRGGHSHGYVEEIDGLFAGKRGPLSGWTYEVNETKPDIDAGSYKLKPGDKVIWEYVRA